MDRSTEDLISTNRHYAGLLGWSPTDVGALGFDPLLVSMIKAQQALLGLDEAQQDGVMGPFTYGKLLTAKIAHVRAYPRKASSQMTAAQARSFNLADQQQIAVWEIKKLWLTKVSDLPPETSPDYERCRSLIDNLIRTELGINWTWQKRYAADNFKWCGTGPAYGYRDVLPWPIRQKWFSSTLRLDAFFSYEQFDETPNPRPSTGPYRMMLELRESSGIKDCVFPDGTIPRAGDVALIGPHGTAYGVHVTTIEQFVQTANGASIITLEHNGSGYWPDGTRCSDGIVRSTHPIGMPLHGDARTFIVRRIGRLAPRDLGI